VIAVADCHKRRALGLKGKIFLGNALGQMKCGFRIDAARHSEEFPPGIPN